MVVPGPAGYEGSIDQVGGAFGDRLDGGDVVCQDLGNRWGEVGHDPADRGLGHAESFCDVGLGAVGSQVLADRHHGLVEGQDTWDLLSDVGILDAVEDEGKLFRGQACAILHGERFVSWLVFLG